MSNQEFIENEISQGEIFNKNRLSDWINPDDYNSLSLVYRIRNDNGRVSKASIGTDISSIGIIQYSTFTNVFSGNLYADVFGRRDEEIPIYTPYQGEFNLIENPADVLYHLAVYLEANNINIEDVMAELEKRKK